MRRREAHPFEIHFENTGDVQLRPTGRIDIISQNGETVRNIRIEEFPLLPGKVRILSVTDTAEPLLYAKQKLSPPRTRSTQREEWEP